MTEVEKQRQLDEFANNWFNNIFNQSYKATILTNSTENDTIEEKTN